MTKIEEFIEELFSFFRKIVNTYFISLVNFKRLLSDKNLIAEVYTSPNVFYFVSIFVFLSCYDFYDISNKYFKPLAFAENSTYFEKLFLIAPLFVAIKLIVWIVGLLASAKKRELLCHFLLYATGSLVMSTALINVILGIALEDSTDRITLSIVIFSILIMVIFISSIIAIINLYSKNVFIFLLVTLCPFLTTYFFFYLKNQLIRIFQIHEREISSLHFYAIDGSDSLIFYHDNPNSSGKLMKLNTELIIRNNNEKEVIMNDKELELLIQKDPLTLRGAIFLKEANPKDSVFILKSKDFILRKFYCFVDSAFVKSISVKTVPKSLIYSINYIGQSNEYMREDIFVKLRQN